jgi:hypothetical protein
VLPGERGVSIIERGFEKRMFHLRRVESAHFKFTISNSPFEISNLRDISLPEISNLRGMSLFEISNLRFQS